MPHTKERLNMLFSLHTFSSFQSNVMTGQGFFLVYVCTKSYRKSRELRCSTFLSRGLIFADLADVLDPQK